MKLLNSNLKLSKASKTLGITQLGLELLPHTLGGNISTCLFSTPDCRKACLVNSGRSQYTNVLKARQARTDLFHKDNIEFVKLLVNEINYYKNIYKNLTIRPNVFSEIQWKDIKYEGKNLFEHCPDVQFLDYVKNKNSCYLEIPNYFTLFSGQQNTKHIWKKLLKDNKPVALVFYPVIPSEYEGYEVVNGDEDDYILKYKDKPVIVGLKYKNSTVKGVNNKELVKDNNLIIKI